MGSYAELFIDGYNVDNSKSYITVAWACLFTENDKRVRSMTYSEYRNEPESGEDDVVVYDYAASAKTIKLRLELMGYTLEKAKQGYMTGIEKIIEDHQGFQQNYSSGIESLLNNQTKHLAHLKEVGFEGWVVLMEKLLKRKLSRYSLNSQRNRSQDTISEFLLDYDSEEMYLGYPNEDLRFFFRAILEAVSDDALIVMDITDLVDGGYYDEDEEVVSFTLQAHINSSYNFQKIIVLTEGKTDSWILKDSLCRLYPEVAEFFSFMDFDAIKVEGGSGALERTVKTFAGAGIANKVIALFDNDAAGRASLSQLRKKQLPRNYAAISLPDIPIAKTYPTLGPQGSTIEDVNGRACSIEMYLGTDILTKKDGQLIPVHWKNLEPVAKAYQGEIDQKTLIHEAFKKKLKKADEKDRQLLLDPNWADLIAIFQKIFEVASKF